MAIGCGVGDDVRCHAMLRAPQVTVCLSLSAGLVITTPQGTLVTPPASSQSFVSGPPATTMIVSTLHPSNAGKHPPFPLHPHNPHLSKLPKRNLSPPNFFSLTSALIPLQPPAACSASQPRQVDLDAHKHTCILYTYAQLHSFKFIEVERISNQRGALQ